MAAMTRANIRTELQSKGWSRFLAADLDRYTDWALQTVYGEGSFDRSVRDTTTVGGTILDQVPFATVSAGAAELVQSIREVLVKDVSGNIHKLTYASDSYFMSTLRPNISSTTPLTGVPHYYYIYDLVVVLYPKPNVAMDVIIDWMRRKDAFTNDADTTGLPERFDKIVVAWAEVFCHRRAREMNEMMNMERTARDMMLRELGQEMSVAAEGSGRVTPWGG